MNNKFTIGQNIVSLPSSTIKAGTKGKIIDCFQEGGFWKYEICWNGQHDFITWAREKDLDLAD